MLHDGFQMKTDTHSLQPITNRFRSGRWQQSRHQGIRRRNHIHLDIAVAKVVGKLTTDQARAHDGDPLLALQGPAKGTVVHQVVDGKDTLMAVTGNGQANHISTPGQHQFTVP